MLTRIDPDGPVVPYNRFYQQKGSRLPNWLEWHLVGHYTRLALLRKVGLPKREVVVQWV